MSLHFVRGFISALTVFLRSKIRHRSHHFVIINILSQNLQSAVRFSVSSDFYNLVVSEELAF